MNKKIVLAFSGGLDTSFCIPYLLEQNYEVHTLFVNTGGISDKEERAITKRAMELGAKKHQNINVEKSLWSEILTPLIQSGALYQSKYPVLCSDRYLIVKESIKLCQKLKTNNIAHGCTGMGNDQVRFDLIFKSLAPDIKIITPIRDNKLSRQQEITYLQSKGIDMSWSKAKYSINKGLWGTSIGGAETLTSYQSLPDEAYPSQLEKKGSEKVKLTFSKGELVAVNEEQSLPHKCIEKLNKLASKYAIGRDIHVGDTIVGIKGRVGFEAAAAIITIKAHHLLEKHILTKWQLQHKEYQSNWYGTHLHEGLFLDPVMRDFEAFLESSQKNISGDVMVTLQPYHFVLDGVISKNDLMNIAFGSYGEVNNGWSAEEVKGFIKIYSNQSIIFQNTHI